MSLKTCARRDGEPVAFGGGSVGGLIAVDQAEARPRLVGLDVESNPAAVGQLGMKTRPHQLADEGVVLAFDQQLGDAAL